MEQNGLLAVRKDLTLTRAQNSLMAERKHPSTEHTDFLREWAAKTLQEPMSDEMKDATEKGTCIIRLAAKIIAFDISRLAGFKKGDDVYTWLQARWLIVKRNPTRRDPAPHWEVTTDMIRRGYMLQDRDHLHTRKDGSTTIRTVCRITNLGIDYLANRLRKEERAALQLIGSISIRTK